MMIFAGIVLALCAAGISFPRNGLLFKAPAAIGGLLAIVDTVSAFSPKTHDELLIGMTLLIMLFGAMLSTYVTVPLFTFPPRTMRKFSLPLFITKIILLGIGTSLFINVTVHLKDLP